MRWGIKDAALGGASLVVLAVLGLTLLLSTWKTVAKEQVLVTAVSPDWAHVAGLRQILASMHGGPIISMSHWLVLSCTRRVLNAPCRIVRDSTKTTDFVSLNSFAFGL